MYKQKILILGGSTEGFSIGGKIIEQYQSSVDIITSFAGITKKRRKAIGKTRIGGFGGVEGLATFLKSENINIVLDATHPFAAQITKNVQAAAKEVSGVHLCHIVRPQWEMQKGDEWLLVGDMGQAAHCLNAIAKNAVVFLAVGRKELTAFKDCVSSDFIARVIDPPEVGEEGLPPHISFIIDRGPFDLTAERRLFEQKGVKILVCKNSGGDAACAKLQVAREHNIPVVMVQRPFLEEEGHYVPTIEAAMMWLSNLID